MKEAAALVERIKYFQGLVNVSCAIMLENSVLGIHKERS